MARCPRTSWIAWHGALTERHTPCREPDFGVCGSENRQRRSAHANHCPPGLTSKLWVFAHFPRRRPPAGEYTNALCLMSRSWTRRLVGDIAGWQNLPLPSCRVRDDRVGQWRVRGSGTPCSQDNVPCEIPSESEPVASVHFLIPATQTLNSADSRRQGPISVVQLVHGLFCFSGRL